MKKGFTTAQAISTAAKVASKQLKKGEDVRKVYPAEGTGKGGRWFELLICCEFDNAETGEHIRDIYLSVFFKFDPKTQTRKLTAELW